MATVAFEDTSLLQRVFLARVSNLWVIYESLMLVYWLLCPFWTLLFYYTCFVYREYKLSDYHFYCQYFPPEKNSLYVGSYGFYNNCSKVIILGCELGLQCTEIFKSFCLSLAVLVKIKNLWIKIRELYLPYGMRNDFIQMRYLKREFSKN